MSFQAPAPLIHIADPAEHALAAFVLVVAFTWWPALKRLLLRPVLAAAHVVVPVAVVAAILPSVFPYDHVRPVGTGGDAQTHAAHCHATPGSCADAPVSAGPGQFVFSDALLLMPALTLVAIIVAATALVGRAPRPDTRPPLAHAAA